MKSIDVIQHQQMRLLSGEPSHSICFTHRGRQRFFRQYVGVGQALQDQIGVSAGGGDKIDAIDRLQQLGAQVGIHRDAQLALKLAAMFGGLYHHSDEFRTARTLELFPCIEVLPAESPHPGEQYSRPIMRSLIFPHLEDAG
ncbi:MAG: hypothetical protein ABI600_17885 [Luteolibacter sp.]